MEPWEDELLWDDDFSEEEKDAEEQIEKTGLEMDADGFADWEDSSDGASENERLEEALAEERALELESELEQDEHPRDYHAELEDEDCLLYTSLRQSLQKQLCIVFNENHVSGIGQPPADGQNRLCRALRRRQAVSFAQCMVSYSVKLGVDAL